MIALPIALVVIGTAGAFVVGREQEQRTRTLLFRAGTIGAGVGFAMLVAQLVPPAMLGLSGPLSQLLYLGVVTALGSGVLLQAVERYGERDDTITPFGGGSGNEPTTHHATYRRTVDSDGSVVREEVGADDLPSQVGGDSSNSTDSAASTSNGDDQSDGTSTDDASREPATDEASGDVDGTFISDE